MENNMPKTEPKTNTQVKVDIRIWSEFKLIIQLNRLEKNKEFEKALKLYIKQSEESKDEKN